MQPAIRNFALIFFSALFFHLAGTWALPLVDRDEPRFAEASREMRERSDYVVPHFNQRYRFDKPPLTYWAQIGSYGLLGENDLAARLPSCVAAALTAVVIFAWGRRMAGAGVGFWAAVMFTLCLQTFIHGKAAVADMWLVLFVTIAHWAGWELLDLDKKRRTSNSESFREQAAERRTPDWTWWFGFYVALALAFLAKGPIGWTPLLTIAAMKIFATERTIAKRFAFVPGVLLMFAIVASWGIPALVRTHGDFFYVGIGRHVVARSFGAMEGHGAKSAAGYVALLPFYFLTVFLSFFPWSIKLPWLTKRLRTNHDPTDNYLIAGTLVVFVIFTLVKTKLLHYTLPAFPLLSLLLARHLIATRFVKRAAVTMAIVYLAVALVGFPIASRAFPAPQLFNLARSDLRPEMEFGAVDYVEPSLVWYFRSRTHGWLTTLNPATVKVFMDVPGARFVLLPTSLAAKLYPELPPSWKSYRTSGVNFVKGKRVDLTMLLKPS